MSKDYLWKEAERQVKQDYDAVPEQHRARLKEIAEAEFPDLVSEIKAHRKFFEEADEQKDYAPAARRFISANQVLFRKVSLFLLGVKK